MTSVTWLLGQSLWEESFKLSPGWWAGPGTPRLPCQLPVHTWPFVTWGMKLKLISSIDCICLSLPWQLKLDAFYLSAFDLAEEKIVQPGFCLPGSLLCKSLGLLSANCFKHVQQPHGLSGAPLRSSLPSQTWVL